jgi:hypothetical protein
MSRSFEERLRANAENFAVRAAAIESRSEEVIAQRIAEGNPPSERELAINRRTVGIAQDRAEQAQRDLETYLERKAGR